MLRSMHDLQDCLIQSKDGDLGKINDFYFDDEDWVIRYLVVATGNWIFKRAALISPIALGDPDWLNHTIPARLSQQQIKNSPAIDVHRPVSRQQEIKYFGYYGYPFYWGGNGLWGEGVFPDGVKSDNASNDSHPNATQAKAYAKSSAKSLQNNDAHLRSWKKVCGYFVQASDGDIGHIAEFLVDEQTFAIRYLVVQTNNWWIGHQVLIAPQWFNAVQWSDSCVSVKLSREAIKNSPGYDPSDIFDHKWETKIREHYKNQGDWSQEPGADQKCSQ